MLHSVPDSVREFDELMLTLGQILFLQSAQGHFGSNVWPISDSLKCFSFLFFSSFFFVTD